MKAFFSDDQLLHDPQQYMRVGRICKPADLPTRAEALMATLATRGITVTAPPDAGREALELVHAPDYLDYLETAFERWQQIESFGLQPGIEVLPNMSPHGPREGACPSPSMLAQTGWYVGDLSCPIGPHTWRSVLRSAHAALAAAGTVRDAGGVAYALCRPSGHHAQRARAAGFCYVNNSAIAAATLRQAHARVAVLDIDAHHGDGTQQIFYGRGDVLTVSTHADPANYYPWYTGYAHERGTGEGAGCNLNLPLAHGSGNAEFARALDAATAAIESFAPQALVLPLGFDTYKDDPISVLKFDMEAFRLAGARVRAMGLPTVVVQEGGYMVGAIGAALDAFLEGLQP
ncbi:histone deacetylase family protein [Paracidovorax cattleyae]|uniref:Acetoin utilization deacetylase AcuC n=1 Tax=Paracidovorax cattleyae TaxID=80868 RepID=A0A1H0VWF8_9BURK|nr:histone deacetylase family protein [Paracidovorax cattleyae]SDP82673.1 Acetoin utilization deacetylase AcuC [Paracidovorax cattleyae]